MARCADAEDVRKLKIARIHFLIRVSAFVIVAFVSGSGDENAGILRNSVFESEIQSFLAIASPAGVHDHHIF